MTTDLTPKYLRVKRKRKNEPSINENQFKKCKYIASLESDHIEDVHNLLQINEIKDFQLIDIDQEESENDCDQEKHENSVITCNGVPLAKHEEDYFVYDIYEFDPIQPTACEESLEMRTQNDDIDSDDEENNEYDYPDEDEYDYEEYDYYRDWQDEEDYKLKEFDKFNLGASSSEESLYFN